MAFIPTMLDSVKTLVTNAGLTPTCVVERRYSATEFQDENPKVRHVLIFPSTLDRQPGSRAVDTLDISVDVVLMKFLDSPQDSAAGIAEIDVLLGLMETMSQTLRRSTAISSTPGSQVIKVDQPQIYDAGLLKTNGQFLSFIRLTIRGYQ